MKYYNFLKFIISAHVNFIFLLNIKQSIEKNSYSFLDTTNFFMNIKNHSSNWLKYLVYDNCCNTKQYILQNLKQITPRAQMNY